MPCGPLQTMQLYALGTGSAAKGALSMFMFALGTVPLMLTFGAISGLLSKGYTKKLLKFSGILVIVLGLIMGNRGLALAGVNLPSINSLGTSSSSSGGAVEGTKAVIANGKQTLTMSANYRGYVPNVLYVQKGIPVNWVVNGDEITSCNNAIVVPSLDIEAKIKKGENIIEEFTPTEAGDINFSCWMGMIRGVIRVVDDINTVDASKADPSLPAPSTPSCCSTPIAETESIYGDDISSAPTERLIKKANINSSSQDAIITGIGYEFDPLITVVNKGLKATINLDLTSFDNPEGKYEVIDGETGKTLNTFEGKKGVVKIPIDTASSKGYGIIKEDRILGIIQVVDDIRTVDLEKIRAKYLN
jgi:plastocyanin domain-containing protein